MVCVDIGANVGYYALLESQLVGNKGKVIAIEPVPDTFQKLRNNINRNDLENIEALNKAIVDEGSECEMTIKKERNMSRVLSKEEKKSYYSSSTVLSSCKLEHIIKEEPDFIRMDLEGYESKLIDQITDLENDQLKILVEVHPEAMEKTYNVEKSEFWRSLSNAGFSITRIIQHNGNIKLTYFFRRAHPPRKVEKMHIDPKEILSTDFERINTERGFRVFLTRQ